VCVTVCHRLRLHDVVGDAGHILASVALQQRCSVEETDLVRI
jgi:hypothetical protein